MAPGAGTIERLIRLPSRAWAGCVELGRSMRETALDTQRLAQAHRQGVALVAFCIAAFLITALAFPKSAAGGASYLFLIAATGAAVAWLRDSSVGRAIPAWLGPVVAYATVLYLGHHIFSELWDEANIWKKNDWGTHHAIARELVDGLRGSGAPAWVHGLTTGEPPFDLYPTFPYYVSVFVANAFDSLDQLPLVLTRIAIVVQVATALGAVRLGLRLVPWPLALLAGVLVMIDRGAGGVTGGFMGILYWGVFHSAVALCFWLFALSTLIDHLRRPRLRTTILLWVLATCGILSHPVGLFAAGAMVVGLLAVAVLAADVPSRRALSGAFHIVLAILLSALVWMPLIARIGLYGVHYGNDPIAIDGFFVNAVGHWKELSQLGAPIVIGLAGVIAGLLSRRAAPTLLAVMAGVLIVAATDQLYLLFEVGPSESLARMSPQRMLPLAKPALFVAGLWMLAVVARHLAGQWRGRTRLIAGALLALIVVLVARGGRPYLDARVRDIRAVTEFALDDEKTSELIDWARARAKEPPTTKMARLLHESPAHELYHVQAESGLPFVALGVVSNLFLRERIRDGNPASLRRFNVRWVLRRGSSPSRGDPSTEIKVGDYRIREVADWDGKFARVERGAGEVVVRHLDDARVEVELLDSGQPALVALGTGYYPRWRARHADGRVVPVFAMPSTESNELSVVAAWLPPGRTTFTPDGPLPSDGKGLLLSILAALTMLAIVVVWSVRRLRIWVLRRMARCVRWTRARTAVLTAAGVAGLAVGFLAAGAASSGSVDLALQVGHGMRGTVEKIKAKIKDSDDPWERCHYNAATGGFRCGQILYVRDTITGLVNDHPQSWAFQAPAVRITTLEVDDKVEFRIRMRMRLSGDYWLVTRGAAVTVTISGRDAIKLHGKQLVKFDDEAEHKIVLQGIVGKGAIDITFVRADSLDPDRDYPTVPSEPPPSMY